MSEKTRGKRGERKDLILDAAEELFAKEGLFNVTLKTIAASAGVDLPLLNYHFSNKSELLASIIRRRNDELNAARLEQLDAARKASGNKSPEIEAVLEALMQPLFTRCSNKIGWTYYATVVSQLINGNQFANLVHESFDPVAQHYISAMRLALPDTSSEKIYWGYQFVALSMIGAISNARRMQLMSRGQIDPTDLESAYKHLLEFVQSGMRGL